MGLGSIETFDIDFFYLNISVIFSLTFRASAIQVNSVACICGIM